MRTYIVNLSATYVTKNSVHADIQQYARKVNRTILNGENEVNTFISQFQETVKQTNQLYKRCKDIELDIQYFNKPDIRLCVFGNFTMDILAGKETD